MKVSFYNIGCKVNFAELSQIREQFENLGYECVDFNENADIVIINTCTVTAKADADSRKFIRRALRISPNAFIAVTGCYAQLKPQDIAQIEGVSGIFGMNYKFKINEYVEKINETKILVESDIFGEFHPACSVDNDSHTRIALKIQDGCDYFCSYCAVPFARGRSRSMDFNKIIEKINDIENSGYYEIVLTGINLGTYKSKSGEDFTDLINYLSQSNSKLRFRISSIEPDLITNGIIEKVANSNLICPHFHIPLQSGSDSILQLMKRRYNVAFFLNLFEKINSQNKNISIGLDIITGFPGETDALFDKTYNLLNGLPFSYLHVFSYSDRDITKASKLNNKVPPNIKKERTHLLRMLSDKKRNEFYNSQLGRNSIVIPETYDDRTGYWFGWTENYVRVAFQAQSDLESHPTKVMLNEVSNTFIKANTY